MHGIPNTDVEWQTFDFYFCCQLFALEKMEAWPVAAEPKMSPEVVLGVAGDPSMGHVRAQLTRARCCLLEYLVTTGQRRWSLRQGQGRQGIALLQEVVLGVKWVCTFISITIHILECVLDKYWHHYGIKKIPLKKEISVFRKDFLKKKCGRCNGEITKLGW